MASKEPNASMQALISVNAMQSCMSVCIAGRTPRTDMQVTAMQLFCNVCDDVFVGMAA